MDLTPLIVLSSRPVATDIVEFVLADPEGGALPAFTPGAHLHVQVPSGGTRQYSLSNDPSERDRYVIAVKREADGKGGSKSLIEEVRAGDRIPVSAPVNDFPLAEGAERAILIAGGIGITPILSMARHLSRSGRDFRLYYLTRSPELTAYREEIAGEPFAANVTFHHDLGDPARAYDLAALLGEPAGAHLYCCGPTGLLRAVREGSRHWPGGSVHFEDFGTDQPLVEEGGDRPFWVVLAGTGERHLVPPGQSILEVLRNAGHDAPSSCEAGTCGTCRARLLEGVPDHRDLVLFDDEMEDNIMICCSRAKSEEIVIALGAD